MATPTRTILAIAAALLTAGFPLAGCRQSAPQRSAGPTRQYPVTGRVVGENVESGEIELDAAAIPGFMDAMTMPYRVKDPTTLKQVHQGDRISGVLDVDGNGTVLSGVKVTDATKEVRDPTPQSLLKPLVPGEAVPDFAFLDQSRQLIHLSDFRGKVLVVTFIYTHCPLSDYCPRMSRNFAEIDKSLSSNAALYDRTHLLSISFDPERDTPAALRSYGGAYTGNYTNETFTHWSFAAPRQADLGKVLEFFDVGSVPAPGNTLTHTLSTVVIGPNGRIVKWYGGNDWSSATVLDDINHTFSAHAAGNGA